MMQRFACLFFVASVALLSAVVPVQTTFAGKRETNAQRFARGLTPLPPVRRSPTDTARRREFSPAPAPGPGANTPTGRLQVRMASDGGVLGYVFNDANGPTGLNLASNPNPFDKDLQVSFTGTSILAENPQFGPPYYVSGSGTNVLTAGNLNTIQFTNVGASDAQGWSLDSKTGQLNLTWTNTDRSKVNPTLIYDSVNNALNFTENPNALYTFHFQVPCYIYLTQ